MGEPAVVSVVELLEDLGGVARRQVLLSVVARGELDRAVGSGTVVRAGRGLYCLPEVGDAARVAGLLGGVVSLTSAALHHGWGVKTLPSKPHVTVGRGRKIGARHRLAHVHYADLGPGEVVDGVTSPAVTLRHCLRALPFDEALCIADSALRESGCQQLLVHLAEVVRGPGSPQVRRVAAHATGAAANPFESTLRAHCLDVAGLRVRAQVAVSDGDFRARADLVDERLRIICEADSFAWHGSRTALAADARRYNRMTVAGWLVLRFSYEEVMFAPDEVRRVLRDAVALAELLVEVGHRSGPAG